MLSRHIPAVRRAVPVGGYTTAERARAAFARHFPGRPVHLCGSGTQALAAAIADAVTRRGLAGASAEVIIPAYGCPDLVAACVFAQVRPRLVDIAADSWGYDRAALRAALGPGTAAIVAVNLLGVGDDVRSVLADSAGTNIPIIQDSAQFVPTNAREDWSGQYIVLSFGRGKPINLMGGGALLGAVADEQSLFPVAGFSQRLRRGVLASAGAALAFNAVTHPNLYGLAMKLPGLGVGATVYHPLRRIEAWSEDAAWQRAGAGLAAYLADPRSGIETWQRILPELERYGIFRLEAQAQPDADRLLRLPLLLPGTADRDAVVQALAPHGVTWMYRRSLPEIEGVPENVREQGPFPNAQRLARRLITLPTHRFVAASDVAAVLAALRQHSA